MTASTELDLSASSQAVRDTAASMRGLGARLVDTADSIDAILDEVDNLYSGYERFHNVADREAGEAFSARAFRRFREMTPREFFEAVSEGDLGGLSHRKVLQLLQVLDEKTRAVAGQAKRLSEHLTEQVAAIGSVLEQGVLARGRLIETLGVTVRGVPVAEEGGERVRRGAMTDRSFGGAPAPAGV